MRSSHGDPPRRMSTPLAKLVEVSRTLAATSGRLDKTALLAALLRTLEPEEVEIAVAFLTGSPRQGRIGLGYATIAKAFERADVPAPAPSAQTSLEDSLFPVHEPEAAVAPPLGIAEVDQVFASIAHLTGSGSASGR